MHAKVSPFLDRPALPPAPPEPAHLHLIDGHWIASCPRCGCELATGWHQGKVEAKAAGRVCPICRDSLLPTGFSG
jgi:hypothetical protein